MAEKTTWYRGAWPRAAQPGDGIGPIGDEIRIPDAAVRRMDLADGRMLEETVGDNREFARKAREVLCIQRGTIPDDETTALMAMLPRELSVVLQTP